MASNELKAVRDSMKNHINKIVELSSSDIAEADGLPIVDSSKLKPLLMIPLYAKDWPVEMFSVESFLDQVAAWWRKNWEKSKDDAGGGFDDKPKYPDYFEQIRSSHVNVEQLLAMAKQRVTVIMKADSTLIPNLFWNNNMNDDLTKVQNETGNVGIFNNLLLQVWEGLLDHAALGVPIPKQRLKSILERAITIWKQRYNTALPEHKKLYNIWIANSTEMVNKLLLQEQKTAQQTQQTQQIEDWLQTLNVQDNPNSVKNYLPIQPGDNSVGCRLLTDLLSWIDRIHDAFGKRNDLEAALVPHAQQYIWDRIQLLVQKISSPLC